ncbi:ABC-1 domain protein OS=Tsukamurella paurometabola (strain ATCC 8368 / DSM / CCUG 35730 / CIP 100753 / JCM 10117 / KCTC 9821 / NBRC 16120 / NCIMB 702349/ NCTC 13040) OX=521096 GN=Tpau_3042 PE=4 SV=1 [Tsukamurella paurometabola]|uniref:ABC-1 domain protein n=1 Tax=Tsukamurella paurometabola (strain ATCC 8368 / DSM 20162 / CCUG 35730 / CIP 100753 / JCM 10117 / KCTC 9821 / NBRC 16120 / NCIMB 702349 / NCTC 13040) TaxID=521096 RepID=D5UUR7_TSUPD|nr:AarF/UbiB family protein [Tsukamurella paurometabola]ADG79635.1 ABC-1 domain protein [Tsukamurella paurometabola DSM 20162]SUP36544.1 Aminoglycoside acetyltransferase regulator [Tsukamurella paurometabola]
MSEITRGGAKRTAKLAGLPLGMAGRTAVGWGKRLAGADKDDVNAELQAKAAEQLFAVLGELKGGAMKLGQAMSVMEAAVPPEFSEPYREALAKLQNEAPPMPAATVHKVLSQQLGTGWRERFQSFDDTAAASASIGQVHRGVWGDGRDVAVKVQYPGADEALRADLKALGRLSSVIKPLTPGTDIKSLVQELTDRTEAELDYRYEATNQRKFAKAFDGDPNVLVPKVIASAPKVIISEWVTGRPLRDVIANGTQAERDDAAAKLTEFEVSAPARTGLLHGDPHPGNFMIAPDGRLIALDFGAVAEYPGGIPPAVGQILRLARDEDYDALFPLLRSQGFIPPRLDLSPEDIRNYLAPYVDPLRSESFHFTRKWLMRVANTSTDVRSEQFQTGRKLSLPTEYVMLFRVLLGMVGICSQMEAEAPYRGIVEHWVPLLDDED